MDHVRPHTEVENPASIAELTIIVPTLNEAGNVRQVHEALERACSVISWRLLFVDDNSDDGTLDILHKLASTDSRVGYIRRVGRRGLSSACLEGMLATPSPYLAVMDGDLQHDEQLLPKMLDILRTGEADLVVASRYVDGGGTGDWGQMRKWMSRLATWLSHFVLPVEISDPMSGFFMLRRNIIQDAVENMNGQGYKILLDLAASMTGSYKVIELPYVFRNRTAGASKLDSLVMWEYLHLLLDKMIGRLIPIRFVSFVAVGSIGAFVHLFILWLAFSAISLPFWQAQGVATVAAMTLNFFFNNVLTYRDLRLSGWNWFRGLFLFYLICSVGAVANLQVADFVFGLSAPWWFAGLLGAVIGSVWNFAVNSTFTWHRSRKTEA